MELDTFLYNLHFDTDKIGPPDWQPDWEDAPLPYKLYRGLPEIPLTADVPLTLKEREADAIPNLEELGHYLWYVYGLTRYAQSPFIEGTDEKAEVSYAQLLRRFVPSGGALYPNELYVYVKLEDVPKGIYHYDVAHHRLLLLREGNYDSYLSRSLGNRYNLSDCFCVVFVSTVFWKNFYKYNNFSYRLQGLDAGVLIGQSLEVANRIGFSSRVCYQFLDRSINHLLALDQQDESVYAVIPLSIYPTISNVDQFKENISATELSREVPFLKHETYNRSKRVIDYPVLKEMNEASMLETTQAFVNIKKDECLNNSLGTELIMLPFTEAISYDLSSVCRERHSPDIDFMMGKVSLTKISTLLKETFSLSYQKDLDNLHGNAETGLNLYGSFYNVEGVQDGAYAYDKSAHALRRISNGDFREYMQYSLTMPNLNLFQVPLCLHVVGDKDHLKKELGYRGYRIQQMEAGILVQRLLLIACALEMGGHPLLGFDSNQSDELYRVNSKEKTCLILIPVGPYRPRAWLKGNLNS
ncbi:SagB family peptide dehydrogenase [Neobacillus massiliamazoniensis]|uniref:NADH oxidase / dehydrogenase n=1 Tax=Neobacillus massiliamazoniensis TaxID=1499688 RepID=A0A0U1NYE0_9BACI|nr:SagB family peptide dehydrogenase [Neobacillus massiliamazoniensis]CRK82888.1 NADH oxidase / dehydrogenase [Neobacillus massiliamazoniensis]